MSVPIKSKNERGSAAVEFILMLPTVLFMIFMTFELAFYWVDRHFMNLAAFEAARFVSVQKVMGNPCEDKTVMEGAQRRAATRMAAVSPSLGLLPKSKNLASVTHLLERLPSALILTQVGCTFDPGDQSLVAQVTYFRAAKMPFVKHFIWAMHVLGDTHPSILENNMISQIPDYLRLVPMRVQMRMRRPSYVNQDDPWKKGMAWFVAPFATSEEGHHHWRAWAQKMSEIKPDF